MGLLEETKKYLDTINYQSISGDIDVVLVLRQRDYDAFCLEVKAEMSPYIQVKSSFDKPLNSAVATYSYNGNNIHLNIK